MNKLFVLWHLNSLPIGNLYNYAIKPDFRVGIINIEVFHDNLYTHFISCVMSIQVNNCKLSPVEFTSDIIKILKNNELNFICYENQEIFFG